MAKTNNKSFSSVVQDVLNFSFSWISNKEMQKYFAILTVVYFFYSLFDLSTDNFSLFANTAVSELATSFAVVAVLVIAAVASIYFSLKVMFKALSLKFSKLRQFNLETIIMLIVLQILTALAALFSVFEFKWLALLGATVVFGVLGTVVGPMFMLSGADNSLIQLLGTGALVLAAICAIAYLVIVFRNFCRLLPSAGLYLRGKSLTASITESWQLTPHKALKIFTIFLVMAVFVAVLSLVEYGASTVLAFLETGLTFGSVPITPISAILSALVSAFSTIFQAFTYAAMLAWLLGETVKAKK
ncbi:MAG: hypothetical protein V1644_01675 [Candidatus Micrarchaeota archaeon]